MEIYEITGYQTGISRSGVNFLQPADSFQNIENGYIHRQVLQSRKGFKKFSTGYLAAGHLPTRCMGIFQNTLTATSETETLAFDKNYLYVYNEGTNAFDRIPFGGSIAAFTGFNLTQNEDYISGTTYPFADGKKRFVFTGRGMPGVYFYDGTSVLKYTDVGDNPNYQAFATGDITRATHVFWFGERLNFVAPTIGATFYPQGMLYSAIRTVGGNGDKFNTSGAGLLQLDTYEHIRGAAILGDRIALNVSKSNWMIEKTRDVFNPYFSRKVPSVLGTDASFSSVVWSGEDRSIGKTGIISTDGRESLKIDNKIPYFTNDEIDVLEFEQTYGGFDRATSQFMWAYVKSGSGDTTQNRVLVNNSWLQWDTTEEIWNKIGLEDEVHKTLAGDDLGFIYELNQDFDDYFVTITGITNASSAVVSTQDQNLQIGDRVVFSGLANMTQMNGLEALVTARTLGSITVNIDSTDFTAYGGGGAGFVSKLINFSAEMVPFNPYRAEGRKCFVSHIEFLLDTDGGSLTVNIFENGDKTPFKKDVLLQPTSTLKDREWITVQINNTSDFLTIKMQQESASVQVKLTSIRIHCEKAGLTTS